MRPGVRPHRVRRAGEARFAGERSSQACAQSSGSARPFCGHWLRPSWSRVLLGQPRVRLGPEPGTRSRFLRTLHVVIDGTAILTSGVSAKAQRPDALLG